MKQGKKTREWNRVRASLKIEFQSIGVTTCEAKLLGCWNDNALSFMHRMKRRKITTEDELSYCALACTPCHDQIERLSADEMYQAVTSIVENR